MGFLFIWTICLWVLFIFLAIKGKMNWASSLALLLKSLIPTIIITLIIFYALPKGNNIQVIGSTIPLVPLIVSFAILLLLIYAIRKPKMSHEDLPMEQSINRFVYLVLGFLFQLGAISLAVITFYAPKFLGISQQNPAAGIALYFILNCFSAAMLYLSSLKNTISRPNLMRWYVFFVVICLIDNTVIISSLLIYAPSIRPSTTYPFLAGINMISCIPYSILLLLLARDYIYAEA
jgi:hypothetical protein